MLLSVPSRVTALTTCAIAFAVPASAQMNMPPVNTYPQNFYVPGIGDMMIEREADAARRGAPAARPTLGARALGVVQGRTRPNSSAVRLTFTPSQARRKANYKSFVEKMRKGDPQGAAGMERLFATTDLFGTMDQALAPLGLKTNDIASAFAVYWVNAWQAAHGDTRPTGREIAQAVRSQAASAMAESPDVAAATDAQKQQLAEALLVQAALIAGLQERYGDDPALSRRLSSAVREGARASGLDLDLMTLTEEGFVPARKTGAAEPAQGASPKAIAADAPGYALLAAAGGAGLGLAYLLGRSAGRKG